MFFLTGEVLAEPFEKCTSLPLSINYSGTDKFDKLVYGFFVLPAVFLLRIKLKRLILVFSSTCIVTSS